MVDGMIPVNEFVYNFKDFNSVIVIMEAGIIWLKKLKLKSRYSSFVNDEICDGIVFVKRFWFNVNDFNAVKYPTDVESCPTIKYPVKVISVIIPFVQLIPVHVHTSDVGVPAVQFQSETTLAIFEEWMISHKAADCTFTSKRRNKNHTKPYTFIEWMDSYRMYY